METIAPIWCKNMCEYLSLDIIFSSKPTVFLVLCFRETVHFLKQVMSTGKYVYILSCQIEALVYIISLRKLNTMF